jgi:hypothetical protein
MAIGRVWRGALQIRLAVGEFWNPRRWVGGPLGQYGGWDRGEYERRRKELDQNFHVRHPRLGTGFETRLYQLTSIPARPGDPVRPPFNSADSVAYAIAARQVIDTRG